MLRFVEQIFGVGKLGQGDNKTIKANSLTTGPGADSGEII
jgi:hypothetical protein